MRIFVSLFIFLIISIPSTAQNGLDQFWKHFENNRYVDGISELEKIVASDATNQEAWLMLAIVADYQQKPTQAFDAFKKFYQLTDKKTEYLVAFWRTSAIYSESMSERKERDAFFQTILDDPAVDGGIKSNIYGTRGNWEVAKGNFEGYLGEISKSQNLTKWQLAGEFENISASGFDKNYSPINQPKSNARFKNKHEADIHWINSEVFRTGEWVRTDYHFGIENTIVFAQTFITSDIDQEVQLRVGTSGSLKTWLNDALVLSEVEEYNNYSDTYRTKVNLKKGVNRLLLQVGSSEITEQNFFVRITDDNGNPLNNFSHSTTYADYPSAGFKDLTNRIELPAEVYFEEQIKSQPNNLLYYILLSRVYLDNGKTNRAQWVLRKAEKLAPKNSLIMVELINLYLGQGNETELGAITEKLKTVEPTNRLSLMLEFNDAISDENYDKAENLLPQLKTALSDNAVYLEKRINLESARDNNQEVLDLAVEGYNLYPDNETFVNYKYIIELNINQDPKAAQKVLKKYMKNHYSTAAQSLYAQSWIDRGDVPQFFVEYKKLLDATPYAVGTMIDLADAYYQTGEYQTALNYLDDATKMAPFVGNLYAKKGEILSDMGEKSKALTNFKKAVDYDPRDFDSRQRIRDIEGKKSPFENFEDKDYYALYKNAPGADAYPEDNAVVLTEEKQVVIHEKGAVEERNYMVVKVFDKAGVDSWKEYSIPRAGSQYLIVEKAEVLKADGSKNVAESSGAYLVFTNLEPGDGIFLSYKLQNYYQGSLAEHYWGKQYFDYFVPAENIEFSVLYDKEEVPLKFEVANGEIEKEEQSIGNKTLVTWSAQDVESIKAEGLMPPLADVGRTLHYTTIPDWNFVSNWYSDLAGTKAKVDFEVKEAVTTVFPEGHSDLSEREKVTAIYEYIVNEIRYSSISFRQSGLIPQKASNVIITKIGDCKDVSTLFVSMCEEVGVDADLVLVNTRNNGQQAMELPSIEFNHCIAKVMLDDEEKFVELTTDLYPFSTVSSTLESSFILEIEPSNENNEPRLLPQSKSLVNGIYRKADVTLSANKMEVEKKNYKSGSLGGNMRAIYRDYGEEARKKSMQEAISGEFPNIKLDELQFYESLENNADSVAYDYSFTILNPYTKIGDLHILKVPLAEGIKPIEFLSVEDRKYDVELWKYFGYSEAVEELTIALPADKKLAEKPDDLKISNNVLDYELSFKMEGESLIVFRRILFKESLVKLEDYDSFKAAMDEIIAADNLQIGIK